MIRLQALVALGSEVGPECPVGLAEGRGGAKVYTVQSQSRCNAKVLTPMCNAKIRVILAVHPAQQLLQNPNSHCRSSRGSLWWGFPKAAAVKC